MGSAKGETPTLPPTEAGQQVVSEDEDENLSQTEQEADLQEISPFADNAMTQSNTKSKHSKYAIGSKLFQPHCTIGYVTSSAPFTMVLTQTTKRVARGAESQHACVCVPLLERYILYKCENLRPVLVSDCLPSTRPPSSSSGNVTRRGPAGERMYHALANPMFKTAVCSHSHRGYNRATHTTLYSTVHPVQTLPIVRGLGSKKSTSWGIVDMIDLGVCRVPVELPKNCRFSDDSRDIIDDQDSDDEKEETDKKEDKMEIYGEGDIEAMEKAAKPKIKYVEKKHVSRILIAMICSKLSSLSGDEDNNDEGVEVLGDSDSEDDDSMDEDSDSSDDDQSSSSSDSSSSEEEKDEDDFNGEVIILRVGKKQHMVQSRIPLKSIPNFTPTTIVHPTAYLNKVLIGGSKGELILLNIRSGKIVHQFQCLRKDKSVPNSKITVLESSPAVDTIAVGTESGHVHLINIRLDVKLFTLYHPGIGKGIHNGSEITSLTFRTDNAAMNQDIAPLAVGQKNGNISVWDLTPRTDEDEDSDLDDFSDDDMESSKRRSVSNKVVRRTLLTQIENAHKGGVSNVYFIPQEPLLLSSGLKSNKIVMHIFDNPNHSGRVLRERSGHSAPPRNIMHQRSSHGGVYEADDSLFSYSMVSAGGKGDRSLRLFNSKDGRLNFEFTQGGGMTKKAKKFGVDISELKLKEITGMANSDARYKHWGDLVTIHENHSMAYVWSSHEMHQSGPVLRQNHWSVSAMKIPPPPSTHATSVCMSACANFALVGTKGGVIYKYNVESGLPNGSYPKDATVKKSKVANVAGSIHRTSKILKRDLKADMIRKKKKTDADIRAEKELFDRLQDARHTNASIVGVAVDTLNKMVISVDDKGKLIVWSFTTHTPHKKSPLMLPSPATKLAHIRDSDLIAIALEDFSVFLFDSTTQMIVRKFGVVGNPARHTGPLTDLIFSPDGRKLFTSSLDGTIRVWDVPTNTCVDWMSFASPPVSMSMNRTGEFLATAHQGRLGISLFSDKSFYSTVHLDGALIKEPTQMDEPSLVIETGNDDGVKERIEEEIKSKQSSITVARGDKNQDDTPPQPKHPGLITLSGLPVAHWKNLFHLELVKERNKPKEAPKKPANAPFFLQWRGDVNPNEKIEADKQQSTIEDGDVKEEKEWASAWSDDDEDEKQLGTNEPSETAATPSTPMDIDNKRKRSGDEGSHVDNVEEITAETGENDDILKRRNKMTTFRSELASLLLSCSETSSSESANKFERVTEYMTSKGPSKIDIELSSLCNGMYDLKEGIILLKLAAMWLVEACKSRQNYEAINAYLHRFLYLHASTIAGIDLETEDNKHEDYDAAERLLLMQTIAELKTVQKAAMEKLRGKMQHSLCLLRHFSRMV